MPKRIIVFCDGTWNSADQTSAFGQPCPTNVARLFQATPYCDESKKPQIVLYIAGVGTTKFDRVIGGGFGYGISKNIREAYRFIVSNYEPGDDIFLFGFSRGAYTARSIVGLINNVGVLRRDQLHREKDAYDHYRDKKAEWRPDGEKAIQFSKDYCHADKRIAFLGVWDTVGALGAPFGVVLSEITNLLFHTQFHDVKLSSIVESACHAVAIDERRWPFRPTLWTLNKDHEKRCAAAKAAHLQPPYEQKWFPGVHSNVGGGYGNTGLSDCALHWMMERAQRRGMCVDMQLLDAPPFAPDLTRAPEQSLSIWYRIPTITTVYLFKPILKRIWPDEAKLLAKVNIKGEYARVIDDQQNIGDAVGAYPDAFTYEGSLSSCAIEKLSRVKEYRPKNVAMT